MKKILHHESEIRGSDILIVGYGREGESVHRYIIKNYPKMRVSIADQNSVAPLFPVVKMYSGKQWLSSLDNFQTVVRSPGVPDTILELVSYKAKGGFVTSSANIFFRGQNRW